MGERKNFEIVRTDFGIIPPVNGNKELLTTYAACVYDPKTCGYLQMSEKCVHPGTRDHEEVRCGNNALLIQE